MPQEIIPVTHVYHIFKLYKKKKKKKFTSVVVNVCDQGAYLQRRTEPAPQQ